MAVISTKELFDAYFDSMEADGKDVKRQRGQVDRKEVYEYEEKIGKQLVDMNVTELLDMIKTFNNPSDGGKPTLSVASWSQISSRYRAIFQFYIENYEVKVNPWINRNIKGKKALEYLTQGTTAFTFEKVQSAINKCYKDYSFERAQYIECTLRLFHEGVARTEEIVTIKENDVDIRNGSIILPGRTIIITPKTRDLLYTVHEMTALYVDKMLPWRGGYYRFPVRRGYDEFDQREAKEVALIISHMMTKMVRIKYDIDVNARTLYMCGLYDRLVEKYGAEETDRMILTGKSSIDADRLSTEARLYGMPYVPNPTKIRLSLMPFCKTRFIDDEE